MISSIHFSSPTQIILKRPLILSNILSADRNFLSPTHCSILSSTCMYTKREILYPSPFTCVQGKVAPPLTNFIIYPLCFLTAYIVTSQPQLFSLKGAEHQIQKTQTSTTFTILVVQYLHLWEM